MKLIRDVTRINALITKMGQPPKNRQNKKAKTSIAIVKYTNPSYKSSKQSAK